MKEKNSKIHCIFCGRSEGQVPLMIKSELGLQGVCIDCANALNDIAKEQKNKHNHRKAIVVLNNCFFFIENGTTKK